MDAVDGASDLDICPPGLMDGWLVHSAAIARGLSTWLLSGQVLYARNSARQELSFAHGVPEQTRLSVAVISQDLRIRRAVLSQQGVRTPKGASFSLGGGLPGAQRYARRIGFPVVLKPMIGENTVEALPGIRNSKDLADGFDYYRTVPTEREDFELSSYTLTTLFWPKEAGGTETRDDYRIMVEEHVRGKYLRFFLLDREVVSVIHAPGGTWHPAPGGGELGDAVHPSILDVARRVSESFPRLYALTVDIVVEDWTQAAAGQRCIVVELSERPWHHVRKHYIGEAVEKLADATLQRSAETAGFELSNVGSAPEVKVELRWQGVSNPDAFIAAYNEKAMEYEVYGQVWVEDPVGGTVSASMHGSPQMISLLNELSVDGGLEADRVMSAECMPWTGTEPKVTVQETKV